MILLVFWAALGRAQQDSTALPVDRGSALVERHFEGKLEERYTGEEFQYGLDRGEPVNLLARAIKWMLNALGELFGLELSPATLMVLEYLIYILMGVLAIYLLVRIFVKEGARSLFEPGARSILDPQLSQRHIEEIDLDALVGEALGEGNFRLAVRYRFLKVLKLLSQREIIAWHFEKTNLDYLGEIAHTPLQTEFRKASYLFENIWYGQRPLDEEGYRMADRHFESLIKSMP